MSAARFGVTGTSRADAIVFTRPEIYHLGDRRGHQKLVSVKWCSKWSITEESCLDHWRVGLPRLENGHDGLRGLEKAGATQYSQRAPENLSLSSGASRGVSLRS